MVELNDDDKRQVSEWLTNFAKMLDGEAEKCLHCEAVIEKLEQVGRCVYARPCNCRQYQGVLPGNEVDDEW